MNQDLIQQVDEILSRLEDVLHGVDGAAVTRARTLLKSTDDGEVKSQSDSNQEELEYLEESILDIEDIHPDDMKDKDFDRLKRLVSLKTKILSLSSKEESKAGFSLEDMEYAIAETYNTCTENDITEKYTEIKDRIIHFLTSPTSKVEAKSKSALLDVYNQRDGIDEPKA